MRIHRALIAPRLCSCCNQSSRFNSKPAGAALRTGHPCTKPTFPICPAWMLPCYKQLIDVANRGPFPIPVPREPLTPGTKGPTGACTCSLSAEAGHGPGLLRALASPQSHQDQAQTALPGVLSKVHGDCHSKAQGVSTDERRPPKPKAMPTGHLSMEPGPQHSSEQIR